jgi:hypothetical protein
MQTTCAPISKCFDFRPGPGEVEGVREFVTP